MHCTLFEARDLEMDERGSQAASAVAKCFAAVVCMMLYATVALKLSLYHNRFIMIAFEFTSLLW